VKDLFWLILFVLFFGFLLYLSDLDIKKAEASCRIVHESEVDPIKRAALIELCVRDATRRR